MLIPVKVGASRAERFHPDGQKRHTVVRVSACKYGHIFVYLKVNDTVYRFHGHIWNFVKHKRMKCYDLLI
jgi:hypothetical protein